MDNFTKVGVHRQSHVPPFILPTKKRFLVRPQFKRLMLQYVSRAASFNPGAKFIILHNNPMERKTNPEHQSEFAFDVFSLMYNRYNAANVVFLYATDVEKYSVYVTNPYRNVNECGSLKPIQLDECTAGVVGNVATTQESIRRPKVPKTMPNCTFKFCARITEPYIEEDCKRGLEIEIITVLQEILQFKVIILPLITFVAKMWQPIFVVAD